MFEGDPERVTQKGHQHVGLGTMLPLMKNGTDRQGAFQNPENCFGFGQLKVSLPKFVRRGGGKTGAPQVSALSSLLPSAAIFADFPIQFQFSLSFNQLGVLPIRHPRMARPDRPQAPLELVAVLPFSFRDLFLQAGQSLFHAGGEAARNRLFFLSSGGRAA